MTTNDGPQLTPDTPEPAPVTPRARPRRNRGLPWPLRLLLLIGFILVVAVALVGTNKNAANAVRNVVGDNEVPILSDALALAPPNGPDQPIPFPHPVHLAAGISCRHCHNYTDQSTLANIAAVELCMECHKVVATDRPTIQKLTEYYNKGEEIPWVRVYNLPDFVYFSHRMHIAAGLDCAQCHGDMTQQAKTYQANTLNMGFCVTCHRQNNAPIECYTCHK